MKFAVFGDIHANLEALEAVLSDAADQGCTRFTCIGDVVGYNADPRECLRVVQQLDCPVVKGNHDEGASMDTEILGLNPLAQRALEWTREALTEPDKQWLRDLPFVRRVGDFTIVHATLDSPSGWNYVTNKYDAMASFAYQFTPICFFGHTHAPCFFVRDSAVRQEMGGTVRVEEGKKYFINVGSGGQPRDGDWRASYVVYDVHNQKVTFRRLKYDIQRAQEKILKAGLPEMLADRLVLGK